LLHRAQHDGAVRTDINLRDIITLVNAIARAAEITNDDQTDRMLAVVLAGMTQPARTDPTRKPARSQEREQ
jgi:hypothetical protein